MSENLSELYPAEWVRFQLSGLNDSEREYAFGFCGICPNKEYYTNNESAILIMKAMSITKDETYGHGKESIPTDTYQFLLRLSGGANNVECAIENMALFSRKFTPGRRIKLEKRSKTAVFSVEIDGKDESHAAAVEVTAIVACTHALRCFIGKHMPIRALLTRSELYASCTNYNARLDAPVVASTVTGVEFDLKYLSAAKNSATPEDPLADAVQWFFVMHKIAPMIGQTDLPILGARGLTESLETISNQRNIDLRQKRRIAYETTSYNLRDLSNAKKFAESIILLCVTEKSINEIAENVGFSDYRSFHRFFCNQSTYTPSEYRRLFGENNLKLVAGAMDIAHHIIENIDA